MSQSPTDALPTSLVAQQTYLQNWNTLSEMIRHGMSFSGRERNRCFLNLRHGEFADVSSATGLDLLDDARGTAFVDWDQDGDLDIWFSNRTSPSVRLMRNNLSNQSGKNHFVALQLEGTHCNRDAIGARVLVEVQAAAENDQPSGGRMLSLSKTLRAGEGFLSQSSKWVHFGIGPAAAIKRVTVRWPDGSEPETFAGIVADGRFRLVQGRGVAARVDDRSTPVTLGESVASVPAPTSAARIVLAQRPRFPRLDYADFSNQTQTIGDPPGGAQLIVLWASWCQPCLEELSELAQQATRLRQAGLAVHVLSADSLDTESNDGMATARRFAEQLQAPFSFGWMSQANMDQLADVHREIIFRQRPLPIPCSFLIDARGQLAVLYKGPVASDQLMADLQLLDARPAEVELAATPFAGRTLNALRRAGPLQIAQAYREGGYWDDARAELNRLIEQVSMIEDLDALAAGIQQTLQPGAVHEWTRPSSDANVPSSQGDQAPTAAANNASASSPRSPPPDLATFKKLLLAEKQRMLVGAYRLLARTEHDAGDTQRELDALQQVVKLQPDSPVAMSEWIVALWQAGQRELARQHLERLAEQTPQDAHALVVVGQTWMKVGEVELAIAKFQQALSQAPDQVEPRLNLAMAQQLSHQPAAAIEHYSWILTHHPDSVDARNNLAWLYATYPEAKFRDGAKAEELARRLCEMSHYTIPTFLDTFAAACAENGHFDEAVRATQLAVSSARGRGEREQEGVRQERLRLYQSSQPYRAP